jgi:tetratricopeptide (TPR) repeat protein
VSRSRRVAVAAGREDARHAAGTRPIPRQGIGLAATLIVVGAIIATAHWPVLKAQALSLDDNQFVAYNPLVTHPGWTSTARFFGEVLSPSTVKGYYLPLSMTSLMLDYAMGGRPDDLRVFHRTNLALHVLNAALVVLILYRLFGALVPAGIAALIFGLHPLTVEPTAWIGERKTLLATFFAFACLSCYLQHCRRKCRAWMAASLVLYLLALLSKPTVIMLPLLLLLLDYWPLQRLRLRALVEKWPFFLLSLAFGVVTLMSHQRTAGIVAPDYLRWPVHAGYLLAFYLGKIIWPTNLSCVYPQPEPFAISNPIVLLSVVATGLLTLLLVLAARRTRGLLMGWLFFVLAIAPTLGVVRYSWVIASDKYVYFPLLGILMILASGLAAVWDSPRLAGVAPKAALLLFLSLIFAAEARGVRTTLRNWTDTLTLYRHLEKVAPHAPVVHAELGSLMEAASAHDEAVRHLRRAIELEPNYGVAHYNLGVVLAGRGQLEESIQHFRRADELLPDDPPTVYNLGMALRLEGRLDEAAAQFRRAARLKPDYIEALNELGGVLVLQGRMEEAVEQLRKALALAPTNSDLHFRVSLALLLRGGHASEAVSHLRQAVRYRPDWPEPLNALAWLLATSPDPAIRGAEEALRLAGRAVELTGGRDPKVLDTLAAAQAAAGHFDEAVRTQRRAIELASQSPADTLARGMRDRMKLYARGTGYTESPGVGAAPPR